MQINVNVSQNNNVEKCNQFKGAPRLFSGSESTPNVALFHTPLQCDTKTHTHNKYPPATAGGISVSGIALILQATHKCVFYWPVSHAFVTKPRSSGTKTKPPLCKGRWHGLP